MATSRPQSPALQKPTATSRLPVRIGKTLPPPTFERPATPNRPATPTTPTFTRSRSALSRPSSPLKAQASPTKGLTAQKSHETSVVVPRRLRDKPLTLLSLPQELQDIIFHHAYPVSIGAKYVCQVEWQSRRKDRPTTGKRLSGSSVFAPFVNGLMVSKAYFPAASRAFIENHDYGALLRLIDASPGKSIAHEHAKSLKCLWTTYPTIAALVNLRALIMVIEVSIFDNATNQDAMHEELLDVDLKSLPIFSALAGHPSLQRLDFIPATPRGGYLPSNRWAENVKALENAIKETLPRYKREEDAVVFKKARKYVNRGCEGVAHSGDDHVLEFPMSTDSARSHSDTEDMKHDNQDPSEPSNETHDDEADLSQSTTESVSLILPPTTQEPSAGHFIPPEHVPLPVLDNDELHDSRPHVGSAVSLGDVNDTLKWTNVLQGGPTVDVLNLSEIDYAGEGRLLCATTSEQTSPGEPDPKAGSPVVETAFQGVDAGTQTLFDEQDQCCTCRAAAAAGAVLIEKEPPVQQGLLLSMIMQEFLEAAIAILALLVVWSVVNKEV